MQKASSESAEHNRTIASFLRREGREAGPPGNDATRRDATVTVTRVITVNPLKSMAFEAAGSVNTP